MKAAHEPDLGLLSCQVEEIDERVQPGRLALHRRSFACYHGLKKKLDVIARSKDPLGELLICESSLLSPDPVLA